jgi:hypothetical protein
MTEEQEERMIQALEQASWALASMAKTYELQYLKTYPAPRTPRDIHVTHPPTEEEELRIDQGATGERTTQEWMTLHDDEEREEKGPRARQWDEDVARGRAAGQGDAAAGSGTDRLHRSGR